MFFVLNTGRAGSNTISRVLSQAPDCQCLHEPEPAFIEEATRFRYGEVSSDDLVRVLRATRPPLRSGVKYGESNNKLALMVPVLERAFPDSRYVWLIRDGRQVVCSGLQRGWFTERDAAENASAWRRWRLRGDRLGVVDPEEWERWSPFEKNCWLWSYTNHLIRRDLQRLESDRTFVVRIESLGQSLPELCGYLGITPVPFVISRANRRVADAGASGTTNSVERILTWHDWSDDERKTFLRQCGDLMDDMYPDWRQGQTWRDLAAEVVGEQSIVAGTAQAVGPQGSAAPAADLMLLRYDLAEIKQMRGELAALMRLHRDLARRSERLDVERSGLQKLLTVQTGHAQDYRRELNRQLGRFARERKEYEKQIQRLQRQVKALHGSLSWRIGQTLVVPMAWVADKLRGASARDDFRVAVPSTKPAQPQLQQDPAATYDTDALVDAADVKRAEDQGNGPAGDDLLLQAEQILNDARQGMAECAPLPPDDDLATRVEQSRMQGDLEQAWRHTIKGLVIRARLSPSALRQFAVLAEERGDWHGVRAYCAEIRRSRPDDRRALALDHRTCLRYLPLDALRNHIEECLREGGAPRESVLSSAVMMAFHEDRNWEEVLRLCREESEPTLICRVHMVLALIQLNELDEAARVSAELMTEFAENDEVDLLCAEVARAQDDREEQIAIINTILARYELAPIKSADQNLLVNTQSLRATAALAANQDSLISVIMTVYGRDELLATAVGSILDQSHQNIEMLIVDDCSPDDAHEWLLKTYADEPRVRVFQTERNSGAYVAKNVALQHSRGEFITFMDSDDWSHPQRLERQLSLLDAEPSRMAVCQRYFRVNEAGRIVFRRVALRTAAVSLMIRRWLFERIGYFVSIRVGADSEYIGRIKAVTGKESLFEDKSPTLVVTHHDASLTGGGRFAIDWRSIRGARLENHLEFRAWHKRIAAGLAEPYVDFPMQELPYRISHELLR
jgi:glycosyltransferase involved in cell wall biosynthesis